MVAEHDGLTVLVTGGSSGIGAHIVDAFLAEGATVALIDRDTRRAHPQAHAIQCDLGDDSGVRLAVDSVARDHGGIDILVNNAGIGAQGTIEDNDDDQWHAVYDINVVGLVRVSRACLPYLRRSSAPAIVNMCSIAATAGLPQRALYSATKGAVLALTRAMAADYVADGIRVNCVNPGTVDTPWVARLLEASTDPEGERVALAARQPHGRLVSPDEVAQAVVYLASPSARSTTGTSIAVDGGMQELRLRR